MSLFRNKNYKVSVCIGINSSHMRPIAFVSDASVGLNFIRTEVLDLR